MFVGIFSIGYGVKLMGNGKSIVCRPGSVFYAARSLCVSATAALPRYTLRTGSSAVAERPRGCFVSLNKSVANVYSIASYC